MINSKKISRTMITNSKFIKKLLLVVIVVVLTAYSLIDVWNNAKNNEVLQLVDEKTRASINNYGINLQVDSNDVLINSDMISKNKVIIEPDLVNESNMVNENSVIVEPNSVNASNMVTENNAIVKPEVIYQDSAIEIIEPQAESEENCEKFKLENYINNSQKSTKEKAFQFIPHLKNPCWYEEYGEEELKQLSNNPFRYTVFDPKYIQKYIDNITTIYNIYRERLNTGVNRRLRCIPYFYIIGQPKCGTTDLYKKLSYHPQIKRGIIKETHWWRWSTTGIRHYAYFFDVEFSHFTDLFSSGSIEIENKTDNRCQSDLNNQCSQQIIGDGSAFAMDSIYDLVTHSVKEGYDLKKPLTVPEYIRWTTPNVKLIVILRNPVDRLFSGYNFFAKMNPFKSQLDFHNQAEFAIKKFLSCMKTNETVEICLMDQRSFKKEIALQQGMYSFYLEEWLKIYSKDQILVLKMEDYKENMRETLNKVYKFLGICNLTKEEEDKIIGTRVYNEGKHKINSMLNITKQMLEEFYRPFNKRLAQIMNDDRFLWF